MTGWKPVPHLSLGWVPKLPFASPRWDWNASPTRSRASYRLCVTCQTNCYATNFLRKQTEFGLGIEMRRRPCRKMKKTRPIDLLLKIDRSRGLAVPTPKPPAFLGPPANLSCSCLPRRNPAPRKVSLSARIRAANLIPTGATCRRQRFPIGAFWSRPPLEVH